MILINIFVIINHKNYHPYHKHCLLNIDYQLKTKSMHMNYLFHNWFYLVYHNL